MDLVYGTSRSWGFRNVRPASAAMGTSRPCDLCLSGMVATGECSFLGAHPGAFGRDYRYCNELIQYTPSASFARGLYHGARVGKNIIRREGSAIPHVPHAVCGVAIYLPLPKNTVSIRHICAGETAENQTNHRHVVQAFCGVVCLRRGPLNLERSGTLRTNKGAPRNSNYSARNDRNNACNVEKRYRATSNGARRTLAWAQPPITF